MELCCMFDSLRRYSRAVNHKSRKRSTRRQDFPLLIQLKHVGNSLKGQHYRSFKEERSLSTLQ
jgi:hypothetical protein